MYNKVYYTLRKVFLSKQPKLTQYNKIAKKKFTTFSGNQKEPENNPNNIWIVFFAGLSLYLINKK